MERRRPTNVQLAGDREAANLAATLGREVATTRRRRRMTQAQLARRVGLTQSRISEIESGAGTGTPLIVWVRIGIALGRPIGVALARDLVPPPADAGHLDAQELVLNLAARHQRRRHVELPTRPDAPQHAVDVALQDDHGRVLILVEIWNRTDDLGRAVRSTDRKCAEAEGLAFVLGGDRPYRVSTCWLMVDTAANRALVARYPAVLRARFPGSSRQWAEALTGGTEPPRLPGIAWIDPRSRRLVGLRLAR